MTIYADLVKAACHIPVSSQESFEAVHCDPLYNPGETQKAWRFDIVRNDADKLIVVRQYRTNWIDLTEYRRA